MAERITLPVSEQKALLQKARDARTKAYAPYSGFKVGAAVLFADGKVVCGCNVENASYGVSICAERTALAAAIADGLTHPIAVAVAGNGGTPCVPCGLCRQFIAEFNPNAEIILENGRGILLYKLSELLPHSFSLDKNCE